MFIQIDEDTLVNLSDVSRIVAMPKTRSGRERSKLVFRNGESHDVQLSLETISGFIKTTLRVPSVPVTTQNEARI